MLKPSSTSPAWNSVVLEYAKNIPPFTGSIISTMAENCRKFAPRLKWSNSKGSE